MSLLLFILSIYQFTVILAGGDPDQAWLPLTLSFAGGDDQFIIMITSLRLDVTGTAMVSNNKMSQTWREEVDLGCSVRGGFISADHR